mgnify:CR=1 FL=1
MSPIVIPESAPAGVPALAAARAGRAGGRAPASGGGFPGRALRAESPQLGVDELLGAVQRPAQPTPPLQPDVLVRRGQQVTLIAANGGVQIRAQGQALTEGAADERVRVQNVSSLKVVEGVVESDGVVRVGL